MLSYGQNHNEQSRGGDVSGGGGGGVISRVGSARPPPRAPRGIRASAVMSRTGTGTGTGASTRGRKLSFLGFAPQGEEEPQLDEEMERGVWGAEEAAAAAATAAAAAGQGDGRRASEDARHVQFSGAGSPGSPGTPASPAYTAHAAHPIERVRRASRKYSLQEGWRSVGEGWAAAVAAATGADSEADMMFSDAEGGAWGAGAGAGARRLFVQLEELGVGEEEWAPSARWIKYEQDMLEEAGRWGEPHVAALSFHSLLELRRCLESGGLELEVTGDAGQVAAVAARALAVQDEGEEGVGEGPGLGAAAEARMAGVLRALLLPHRGQERRHRHEHHASMQKAWREGRGRRGVRASEPFVRALSSLRRGSNKSAGADPTEAVVGAGATTISESTLQASSVTSLRGAGAGLAECAAVLVGALPGLRRPAAVLLRTAGAPLPAPHFTASALPLRFLFVLLAPPGVPRREVGRALGSLLAEPTFQRAAYRATERRALLSALNAFLDDSIVLPPDEWRRADLLPVADLRARTDAIRHRKQSVLSRRASASATLALPADPEKRSLLEAEAALPLKAALSLPSEPIDHFARTGRPFGGVIRELKARLPFYASDFKDALSGQVLAATVFMYFAALSSAITFGGLFAEKTGGWLGVPETLAATAAGGAVFALGAAQPLMITGATGPLLLMDAALYAACSARDLPFLSVRLYCSLWMLLLALAVAAAEGSRAVKFISRFTEDIFAFLICLIFLSEPISNIVSVYRAHPLLPGPDYCLPVALSADTGCALANSTIPTGTANSTQALGCSAAAMTSLQGPEPNTALYSTVLMLATFTIAYYLRIFRNGKFLGRSVRRALGDFGVPLAIVAVTGVSLLLPVYTERLRVPSGLQPSLPRPWLVPGGIPAWAAAAALLPAMAVYIIIFMETHIAELIVHKPEKRLRKGTALHWDVVLLAVINVGCGAVGAPFQCVATVRSVSHVAALTVMSSDHAPGDKPYVVQVKEQRLSGLAVAVLVGLSAAGGGVLRAVPMSVLFGVFLYMGVSALAGVQFWQRAVLLLRPAKHHPQSAPYVRRVPTLRMHLYTCVQAACVLLLYLVKSSRASLALPLCLLACVPLRAALSCLFTPKELRALDGAQHDVDEDDEPDFYNEAPLPG